MDNERNRALVQRPAPFSWEAGTVLLHTVQETNPIRVQFPRPVVILSAYPSVCGFGTDDSVPIPSLDDLFVRIEQETGIERRLTSRFDTVQPNGIGTLPNVTLGSYRDTTGGARTMELQLGGPDSARPELQVFFSWKRPLANGVVPYQDIYVSLVFHCDFC